MPVMMPRQSDSDMCRDGANTATLQSKQAADEHGKVHSVSDHHHLVDQRKLASIRQP